ncbi:hypothetical protein [Nafulsella turpanensis]|uniref:hypothetical protein n=1 Tax=Nafulsella turpanensis TaxID=1265690 RepID=UPI0003652D30|nr:hypothetical protein [Nafulsella turpanensis]
MIDKDDLGNHIKSTPVYFDMYGEPLLPPQEKIEFNSELKSEIKDAIALLNSLEIYNYPQDRLKKHHEDRDRLEKIKSSLTGAQAMGFLGIFWCCLALYYYHWAENKGIGCLLLGLTLFSLITILSLLIRETEKK